MQVVLRVFVEKKPGFNVEAEQLLTELKTVMPHALQNNVGLRIINMYDVEGISETLFKQCIPCVFSEPQQDNVYEQLPAHTSSNTQVFAVRALPGQFDQRAESAAECIQLISQKARPTVSYTKVYVLEGEISKSALDAIKDYVINPVEACEVTLEARESLTETQLVPASVKVLDGFTNLSEVQLQGLIIELGLACDVADLTLAQKYFAREGRQPTITEIRMLDTYWSDHCRHTTFNTQLDITQIDDVRVADAYEKYLDVRRELGRSNKPISLMDMGCIGAKYLKYKGILRGLDESEEINACTIKCKVDVDGQMQDWLYLFKNETHNHPTEIEPFGGAATCLGGAIRDPLSGRAYVYQAMRVSGSADPRQAVEDTLHGKLPQRKIVSGAVAGYSSYGNQIGIATGKVTELYHPGYAAKHMEVGAVVGAAPASHVKRETPCETDVVVLLGGRTGRDGIGGATGSSKAHSESSINTCGSEVQKGNAPVERKLQRLFRRECACRLIKRCNDFGAGGVSVALGEIADGLDINLNAVTKKYEGLDGTELAMSESQERMACVVAANHVDEFIKYANEENLEATVIANVTHTSRVKMHWNAQEIVNVSREFLESNGAPKFQRAHVSTAETYENLWQGSTFEGRMEQMLTNLNVCSNKNINARFDSTIGAASVLAPLGGKTQLSPIQAMVSKLPVQGGDTSTCSGLAFGANPYIMEKDQFAGAYLAVVESVSRLVATGFNYKAAYLSFQEYFEKLGSNEARWGKPVSALLGALMAQLDLGVGAIGGKDSMSGTFEDLDVPPTLISFATAIGNVDNIISPEFKAAGSRVVWVSPRFYDEEGLVPSACCLVAALDVVQELIATGCVKAASTLGFGCAAEALFKMCVGNQIGISLEDVAVDELFWPAYGSFILELEEDSELPSATQNVDVYEIGKTTVEYKLVCAGNALDLAPLQQKWESVLNGVFGNTNSTSANNNSNVAPKLITSTNHTPPKHAGRIAHPRVIIPVFPGTNCEYDTQRAFETAGAKTNTLVFNNLTPVAVAQSIDALASAINNSEIIMLPGGFSGGDEPEGSAKLIVAAFRSPKITEAVRQLLFVRKGLMLGICNGFQALVKLGLLPYGDIRDTDDSCPTLTFNTAGHHQSTMVNTRIASNLSPWLAECKVGSVYTMPVSNGEGRFVASDSVLNNLVENGQVATQYVDAQGKPSMTWEVNPSESVLAIEGITSTDGRILGKMGHAERRGANLYKNITGNTFMPLFEGGVNYFG